MPLSPTTNTVRPWPVSASDSAAVSAASSGPRPMSVGAAGAVPAALAAGLRAARWAGGIKESSRREGRRLAVVGPCTPPRHRDGMHRIHRSPSSDRRLGIRRWLFLASQDQRLPARQPWSFRPLARDLRGNGAEATLAHLELCERAHELLLGELRPHASREVELGVRALPEEEIAEALFAAGANEEIDIADREGIVRDLREQVREALARQLLAVRERGGLHDGLARRVIDGDAEMQVSAVGGGRFGFLDRHDESGRQ